MRREARRRPSARRGDTPSDLLAALYDVALGPSRWQGWLARLCQDLEAEVGAVVFRFAPASGGEVIVSAGPPDPAFGEGTARRDSRRPPRLVDAASYLAYLAEEDPLLSTALSLAPGELSVLSEALAHDEYVASRFHREWLRPRGLHHLVCAMVARAGAKVTALALLRRLAQPRFAQGEIDLLRSLLPHLQRVVSLQETLLAAARTHATAAPVLESLRWGATRLDDVGRVYGANDRVATLLERGDGPRLDRELLALDEDALHQRYGLTPAEVRVATRIARGQTVASIAASLGVRRATVRTQLQQALAKTGTHRQAELVRLLLTASGGAPASSS